MLEDRIGRDHFIKLCSEMADKDVQDTAHFLAVLATLEGEETAGWFEQQLRTY